MPGQDKYFIDIHCHLFNVEHVPLRQTIRRITENFNKGLVKRGLIASGAMVLGSIAGTALALGSNKIAKEFFKAYEAFIRFFDQPIQTNIADLLKALKVLGTQADIDKRVRIFTPLIMDFERCETYKSLSNQASDLKRAIEDSAAMLGKNQTLILPFLGMDLRRFHDHPQTPADVALQGFFTDIGISWKPASDRRMPDKLANADFVGIKLYPSLGFDIFPQDKALCVRNVQVLKAVMDMDLPITTHCQIASYECDPGDVSNNTLINFANPEKWWRLLEAYPQLSNLRINFAHFGGEQGVAKVFMWNDEVPDPQALYLQPGDLFSSSWIYWIIRLLKIYPNAYSDISAFDFSDKKAVASLAWLLARDAQGAYDDKGPFRLLDKLMWGSDIPMILSDHGTYKSLFEAFHRILDFKVISSKADPLKRG